MKTEKIISFAIISVFIVIPWSFVIWTSLTRCKKCHRWCQDEAECLINQFSNRK